MIPKYQKGFEIWRELDLKTSLRTDIIQTTRVGKEGPGRSVGQCACGREKALWPDCGTVTRIHGQE